MIIDLTQSRTEQQMDHTIYYFRAGDYEIYQLNQNPGPIIGLTGTKKYGKSSRFVCSVYGKDRKRLFSGSIHEAFRRAPSSSFINVWLERYDIKGYQYPISIPDDDGFGSPYVVEKGVQHDLPNQRGRGCYSLDKCYADQLVADGALRHAETFCAFSDFWLRGEQ